VDGVNQFEIGDLTDATPNNKITTWLFDPPYNINFKYSSKVKDNLTPDQYRKFILNACNKMFDNSKDNASLFIVHRAEIISRYLSEIESTGWELNQWITWVYNTNTGHSKSRFTRASRVVLWFVKGDPEVNNKAVIQPYKNPNDKRIKELISKGRKGVALYDWWNINLRKNVSKGFANWFNQLPYELVRRVVLTSSKEGDFIGDLTAGAGTLLEVGINCNRNVYLNDIDGDALPLWRGLQDGETK
jgi:DNA modification methylase